MADTDSDTETDAANVAGDGAAPAGGLARKLMITGGAVLLLAGGLFAGPVVQNLLNPPADDAAANAAAETADAARAPVAVVPGDGPEIYAGLHPPLVVNFQDALGDSHYMQITMEVMARDQDVIDAVKEHLAVIRNSLILIYGGVDYDAIRTREGKEKMLADGLQEIQAILQKRIGRPGVEALYFTSFIIQ